LQAELDLPAMMDNDANVGALGEAFYGAGQGCDPLFYMTLSTGIGGGIVSRGEVLRETARWLLNLAEHCEAAPASTDLANLPAVGHG
jgi:hypothetical protein